MQRVLAFLVTPVLLLCAFGFGGENGNVLADPKDKREDKAEDEPDNKPVKEGDAFKKSEAPDTTDATIKPFRDGTAKAAYRVTVLHDPKSGQYWETTSTMKDGSATTTTRWTIVRVESETILVEKIEMSLRKSSKHRYVTAFTVSMSARDSFANVKKAWIGKPGEKGKEITVMEKPVQPGPDAKETNEVKYEHTQEEFEGLELAGRSWSGMKSTTKDLRTRRVTKLWEVSNGWFDRIIKMETDDAVTELVAMGDDGQALLKWDDVEKDEKKPRDG